MAPPILAARKGFKWYCWVLAGAFGCGILPLIILMFLPIANRPGLSPEKQEGQKRVGNIVGAVFTVLGAISILMAIVGIFLSILQSKK